MRSTSAKPVKSIPARWQRIGFAPYWKQPALGHMLSTNAVGSLFSSAVSFGPHSRVSRSEKPYPAWLLVLYPSVDEIVVPICPTDVPNEFEAFAPVPRLKLNK